MNDAWTTALLLERAEFAKGELERLSKVNYKDLSSRDRALYEAYGFFSLSEDEKPSTDLE